MRGNGTEYINVAIQAAQGRMREMQECKKMHKRKKREEPQEELYVKDKPYEENLSERMRNKIDDAVYRELYSRRMQIIEPVFSNMIYNKGMNRFTLRTQIKVNIQWLLYCIVHNIGKCIKTTELKYEQ